MGISPQNAEIELLVRDRIDGRLRVYATIFGVANIVAVIAAFAYVWFFVANRAVEAAMHESSRATERFLAVWNAPQQLVREMAREHARSIAAAARVVGDVTLEAESISTIVDQVESEANALKKHVGSMQARIVKQAEAIDDLERAYDADRLTELRTALKMLDADELSTIGVLNKVEQATSLVPVGTIVAYWGRTRPDGWLFCDGEEIDEKHAKLRELIGNRTPNLMNRVIVGTTGFEDTTFGNSGGNVSHSHGGKSHANRIRGNNTRGRTKDLAHYDHTHDITIEASSHLPPHLRVHYIIKY